MKYVARLISVSFKQDDEVYTVAMSNRSTNLAERLSARSSGDIKMVVADSTSEAKKKIGDQLKSLFAIHKVDPSAFTFDVGYSEIDADGLFWTNSLNLDRNCQI